MLTLIFVVAAVTTITVHYLLVERRRERRRAAAMESPVAERLSVSFPEGTYLQPAFTWSRIARSGDLLVGVHPLLRGMMGRGARIDIPVPSRRVQKGDPLVRIRVNGREVILPAPASGAISEVRAPSLEVPHAGESTAGGEAWACRLRPDDLSLDASDWLDGESARSWAKERYRDMREYLMRSAGGGDLGLTLADGGDIPVGALQRLSDDEWEAFRARFLNFVQPD